MKTFIIHQHEEEDEDRYDFARFAAKAGIEYDILGGGRHNMRPDIRIKLPTLEDAVDFVLDSCRWGEVVVKRRFDLCRDEDADYLLDIQNGYYDAW